MRVHVSVAGEGRADGVDDADGGEDDNGDRGQNVACPSVPAVTRSVGERRKV